MQNKCTSAAAAASGELHLNPVCARQEGNLTYRLNADTFVIIIMIIVMVVVIAAAAAAATNASSFAAAYDLVTTSLSFCTSLSFPSSFFSLPLHVRWPC